jgi:hypothetical protein
MELASWGSYSNEFSSAKTLDERELCTGSQMSEKSFDSVYRVYSVSTDNVLMRIREV